MMKNKVTLLNMVSGLVLQIFTIVSGFIIPRIILEYFGSEVNGLVSSLNQFLGYISLLEGGITGVIVANLYKPLVDNDMKMLSSTLVTAKKFYNKIGIFFIGYSFVIALIYPIVFNVNFSYIYIFSLTVILSVNLWIQYMFSLTIKTLLDADKKSYVVSFSQTLIVILNIILAIISIKIYPSIHILKLISGSIYLIQPLIFWTYAKKHYKIDWKCKVDNELIKERWDGFSVNLAAFIHNGADIVILTIFSDLKTVSIYSVYNLICSGLKQLVNACFTGISHTVGQAYARKDFEEVNRKLNIYEYVVFVLVFFVFTVSALMITPFVQIYTNGINDAEYSQPLFGILLIVSEMVYLVKFPHLNLAYAANKFKELTRPAYTEAILNIVISIVLVRKLGLIGVACGTMIAMTYRMIFHIKYTEKLVPGRKQRIFYNKLFIFLLYSLLVFSVCHVLVPYGKNTILNWIIYAIIYSIIDILGMIAISTIFFKKELQFLLKYLRNKGC